MCECTCGYIARIQGERDSLKAKLQVLPGEVQAEFIAQLIQVTGEARFESVIDALEAGYSPKDKGDMEVVGFRLIQTLYYKHGLRVGEFRAGEVRHFAGDDIYRLSLNDEWVPGVYRVVSSEFRWNKGEILLRARITKE